MRELASSIVMTWALVIGAAGTLAPGSYGQTPAPAVTQDAAAAPIRVTLQDALERARHNSVVFQAAAGDAAIAREDRTQARDALLPTVTYNNSGIYTQGGGVGFPVRYIANNAVHEYISQGNVHETLGAAGFADLHKASALAAVARAKAEIASRGLVVTVTQSYYATLAAQASWKAQSELPKRAIDFLS